jgi:hypothetical protein
VIGDPGEHVGEPSLWVDGREFGGLDQGVHRRGALATAIGAGEEPSSATDRNRPVILPGLEVEVHYRWHALYRRRLRRQYIERPSQSGPSGWPRRQSR